MSKKIKKINLLEKVEITDPDYATKLYEKEKRKWKFKLICTGIAALGSIAGLLIGNVNYDGNELLIFFILLSWFSGIIATIITSPINIFRVILKCGSVAYHIVPFLLIDLVAFIFGLTLGFLAVMMLPVIPCLVTLYQSHQNMKYAKYYLAMYHHENTTIISD